MLWSFSKYPFDIIKSTCSACVKGIGGSGGQKTSAFYMKVFLIFSTPLFTEC